MRSDQAGHNNTALKKLLDDFLCGVHGTKCDEALIVTEKIRCN